MRKIFAIMLLAISMCVAAQDVKPYIRSGKVFTQVVKAKSGGAKSEAKKTGFTWKDSKGKEYDIYMSKTGSCFVNRVSAKTGKEYRSYLGAELSREICKELKVEYKGKTK